MCAIHVRRRCLSAIPKTRIASRDARERSERSGSLALRDRRLTHRKEELLEKSIIQTEPTKPWKSRVWVGSPPPRRA